MTVIHGSPAQALVPAASRRTCWEYALEFKLRYPEHRASAAAIALIFGWFAIGGASAANDAGPSGERIVALASAGDNALIKANAGALYRSGNEGRDWERIALPETIARGRIAAVSIPAQSRGLLYVAGPGFGILRSADGGRSWVTKNDGLPSSEVVALSAHADQPATAYVYVAGHGLFRSEDMGDHWRMMDAGPREKILQLVHSDMPGSMQTGWFFAATAKGVGRSMDCFCGWRDAGGLARAVTAVAYDPRRPAQVYAASGDRLYSSGDGGEHWSQAQAPGTAITALVVTPAGVLYAAAGEGGLFKSADHGSNWRQVGE
ncbi:MAG: hypothetical protein ABIR52_08935 [Casimicrobiaceae bacterium]